MGVEHTAQRDSNFFVAPSHKSRNSTGTYAVLGAYSFKRYITGTVFAPYRPIALFSNFRTVPHIEPHFP
jgi:hypothetical protein